VIEFWLSGLRGFWFGFHKAFYHNKKPLDKLCLSINDEKYINRILEFLAYGEFTEIFQVADAFYELYEENLESCDVQEVFQEISDRCSKAKQCNAASIIKNAETHTFELAHTMSSMIDLATNEEITDADSFYENMNELGADLAETITALLNI
jgi:hypothetical protein